MKELDEKILEKKRRKTVIEDDSWQLLKDALGSVVAEKGRLFYARSELLRSEQSNSQ